MHQFTNVRPLIDECPILTINQALKSDANASFLPLWRGKFICTSEISGYVLTEELFWEATATPFGGRRPWLVCPKCNKYYSALYLSPEAHTWSCRKCHELVYRSQRFHREWVWENLGKYVKKQRKIQNKLKNKYLRMKTKIKLMNQLIDINNFAGQRFEQAFKRRIERVSNGT